MMGGRGDSPGSGFPVLEVVEEVEEEEDAGGGK